MLGILTTAYLISVDPRHQNARVNKLDSGRGRDGKEDPLVVLGRERKVIVQRIGEEPEERTDVVETGDELCSYFSKSH